MDEITPPRIRYIKLGAGGAWEEALSRGRLEWGAASDAHLATAAGDWEAVARGYRDQGVGSGTVTGYTNEAKRFFAGDADVLWITFARGRMWWAFAAPPVYRSAGNGAAGLYYRQVEGGWRDHDVHGAVLEVERLSTLLTQLSAYRRTICTLSPEQHRLCLRYINASPDEEQQAVALARAELLRGLTTLIRRLTAQDFEQLVDLAFARSGWIRVSSLGGTLKDVDLVVQQPLTGERMQVQVKSSATQQVVNDYARRLEERAQGAAIMLVCHSPVGPLTAPKLKPGRSLQLLLGEQLAELAINAGLTDWIVQHAC